jgi:nucleotide-binding universal stress UspA family protein
LPALIWAAAEARLRQTSLRVVSAWQSPLFAYSGMAAAALTYGQLDKDLETATELDQRSALERAGIDASAAELVVRAGRPAQVLLDASKDAALLVVGARGSGVWGRLVLGSTSTEVVHHSPIPVVVVPGAVGSAAA